MSQFEYAAVLLSIIVGLALTQILRGVGRMVTMVDGPRPYWVHLVWTLYLFVYITMFWWWEFQLGAITWSLSVYLLVIVYAMLLFFASLVLQPGIPDGIDDYKDYYYRKRHWFFGLLMAIVSWDLIDTLLKGTDHVQNLGSLYLLNQTTGFIGSAFAIGIRNELYHKVFAIAYLFLLAVNMVRLFFDIN